MPTFLILKGSSVRDTIRGANPTALRTAVLSAAADAAKGPAGGGGFGFTGKGQSLGSTGATTAPGTRAANGSGFAMPNLGAMAGNPAGYSQGSGLPQMIVRFVGLYLQTLFSFEPMRAAETSSFRVQRGNTGGARVGRVG
jgi:hypothetical protein